MALHSPKNRLDCYDQSGWDIPARLPHHHGNKAASGGHVLVITWSPVHAQHHAAQTAQCTGENGNILHLNAGSLGAKAPPPLPVDTHGQRAEARHGLIEVYDNKISAMM